MVLVQPSAASSSVMDIEIAMSRPWRRRERPRDPRAPPPPKNDEKMSSIPMPPKMSLRST